MQSLADKRELTAIHSLVGWTVMQFQGQVPDVYHASVAYLQQTSCNMSSSRRFAHLFLGDGLLYKILGVEAEGKSWLAEPGESPFFGGARFQVNGDLVAYIRSLLEEQTADSDEVKANKTKLRNACQHVLNLHTARGLMPLYEDTAPFNITKKLLREGLHRLGIHVTSKRATTMHNGNRPYLMETEPPTGRLALALCLRNKYRGNLIAVIPYLLDDIHTSPKDLVVVTDAMRLFYAACEATDTDPMLHLESESRASIRGFMPRAQRHLEMQAIARNRVTVEGMEDRYEDVDQEQEQLSELTRDQRAQVQEAREYAELRLAQQTAEALFANTSESSQMRAIMAAENIEEESDSESEMSDMDDSPVDRSRRNPFVSDEAEEASERHVRQRTT